MNKTTVPNLHPFLAIFFINFILLILMMVVFFSFFANPVGFEIRIPVENVVNTVDGARVTVRITSENVLYLNDRVVTINELKRALGKISRMRAIVDVRVDRRASIGRLSDVFDLCKGLEIAQVKIIFL